VLPTARALTSAGILFFDADGRVMLVEPTYKDHWEIPGGIMEGGETPREACRREVKEELGLDIEPGRLLVVDWAPAPPVGDKVLFVFDGGVLDAAKLDTIIFADGEIASYAFVAPDAVSPRVPDRLAKRISSAVAARDACRTSYLEHGLPA